MSSYGLQESGSAEELGSYQTVDVSDGVQVDSDNFAEHFDSSNLFRCFDEAVSSEMKLLLESDSTQKQCQTEVRFT